MATHTHFLTQKEFLFAGSFSQIPVAARPGPGRSQEPGTASGALMGLSGTQVRADIQSAHQQEAGLEAGPGAEPRRSDTGSRCPTSPHLPHLTIFTKGDLVTSAHSFIS